MGAPVMSSAMAVELLERLPDGLFVVEVNGTIQWCNSRAEEMFSYDPGELCGLAVDLLLPEGMRATHARHRQRFSDQSANRPMGNGLSLVGQRRDGSEFPVDVSLSFLSRDGERLAVAAVRDETERRLVERALMTERQHKATLLESLDQGFMEVDITGRVVETNARFCEMVGLAQAAVIGAEPPYPWWPPGSGEEVSAEWRRLLSSNGGTYERIEQRSDGSKMFVEGSLTPVVEAGDARATLLNVVRDVSGRIETEVALLKAEQAIAVASDRERIARSLHDSVIQQIFAVGLGLQAMSAGLDGPKAERVVELIEQLDATIADVRNAIFELHRTERRETLTNALLRVVDDSRRSLGFDPGLTFEGPMEQVPKPLAAQVVPVLREALSNVARHANATRVDVVAVNEQNRFRLTVDDNGSGLAADPNKGDGLNNMAGRATDLGGTFSAAANSNGGTHVEWVVPITD